MRLTKADKAAILRREIEQAQGYDADELASVREQALQYYQGELPAKPVAGRSGIVSLDVADTVHSLLAQIMPIVKTTSIDFEPMAEQDESQAQAESDFVRRMVERSDGWTVLSEAVHDALLTGNGWLRISVDESEQVTQESYPAGLTDVERMVVSQLRVEGEQVELEDGDQLQITRITPTKKLLVECVPPENMLFSLGQVGGLDKQRMVAERRLYSVSQLLELGVSQDDIDQIPDAMPEDWPGSMARSGRYGLDDTDAVQEAERLKEIYCAYLRLDAGGKNRSELRYMWLGGNELLKDEPAEYIPYVTGSAIPMPHRVVGTGIATLLKSIQDGKTEILRNYLDNLSVMNASRVGAVEGMVNMSDLTNGRINGVVRMRSPDAVVPLPSADIGPQAMAGLEYLDQVRVQRTGAAVDLNELQAQIMSSSATAAAGQLAKVEQMAGWYALNLTETLLKPLWLLVHRTLRDRMPEPVGARIRGQWQQTQPGQWQPRETMNITLGMTSAEKAARIMALTQVITQQQQMLQMGAAGVLVDNAKIYSAMCDWIRANDIRQPEEYLIDPSSQQAQQAQQQQAQNQQQQAQQQIQLQQQMMQMQQQFELLKQERDLEYKRWSDMLDAEVEEAKITQTGIATALDAVNKDADRESARAEASEGAT